MQRIKGDVCTSSLIRYFLYREISMSRRSKIFLFGTLTNFEYVILIIYEAL